MPFSLESLLPFITTGLGALGNYLGGRSQTNAISQAGQINQQATQDAMNQILSLYDQGRADLSPYRAVGQPALNRLQTLAGHPASSIGVQMPPRNALARPVQATTVPQSTAAVRSATGQVGGGGNALRSVIGTGAGLAGGAILGGAGAGALAGPIGAGVGALGGLIASQFGKHNPSKEAASRGVDELSRQVWGTNTPGIPAEQLTSGLVADVVQGRKTVQQGKAEFTQLWNGWLQSMRDAGVDETTIRNSEATQKQYFLPVRDTFARLEGQGLQGGV